MTMPGDERGWREALTEPNHPCRNCLVTRELRSALAKVTALEATAKINLAALVLARDAVKVLERYAMHNPSCPKFKLNPGKCSCGLDGAIRGRP